MWTYDIEFDGSEGLLAYIDFFQDGTRRYGVGYDVGAEGIYDEGAARTTVGRMADEAVGMLESFDSDPDFWADSQEECLEEAFPGNFDIERLGARTAAPVGSGEIATYLKRFFDLLQKQLDAIGNGKWIDSLNELLDGAEEEQKSKEENPGPEKDEGTPDGAVKRGEGENQFFIKPDLVAGTFTFLFGKDGEFQFLNLEPLGDGKFSVAGFSNETFGSLEEASAASGDPEKSFPKDEIWDSLPDDIKDFCSKAQGGEKEEPSAQDGDAIDLGENDDGSFSDQRATPLHGPKTCKGINEDGTPCGNHPPQGSDYCHVHQEVHDHSKKGSIMDEMMRMVAECMPKAAGGYEYITDGRGNQYDLEMTQNESGLYDYVMFDAWTGKMTQKGFDFDSEEAVLYSLGKDGYKTASAADGMPRNRCAYVKDNKRCKRNAKVGGYCTQHARILGKLSARTASGGEWVETTEPGKMRSWRFEDERGYATVSELENDPLFGGSTYIYNVYGNGRGWLTGGEYDYFGQIQEWVDMALNSPERYAGKVASDGEWWEIYEVRDGVPQSSDPYIQQMSKGYDGFYAIKHDPDWGDREFGPYGSVDEAVRAHDLQGKTTRVVGKAAAISDGEIESILSTKFGSGSDHIYLDENLNPMDAQESVWHIGEYWTFAAMRDVFGSWPEDVHSLVWEHRNNVDTTGSSETVPGAERSLRSDVIDKGIIEVGSLDEAIAVVKDFVHNGGRFAHRGAAGKAAQIVAQKCYKVEIEYYTGDSLSYGDIGYGGSEYERRYRNVLVDADSSDEAQAIAEEYGRNTYGDDFVGTNTVTEFDSYGEYQELFPYSNAEKVARSAGNFATAPRVPDDVDTSENGSCPLCGDPNYDGQFCNVCGYEEPPEGFGPIDLETDEDYESYGQDAVEQERGDAPEFDPDEIKLDRELEDKADELVDGLEEFEKETGDELAFA